MCGVHETFYLFFPAESAMLWFVFSISNGDYSVGQAAAVTY